MKNHNVIVGVFVTAAIVVFGACLFLIGNQHKAFNRHVVFYTNFHNVDGLPKGATVRVDGMDAGELEIPPEDECRGSTPWIDPRGFAGDG
jgi:phospholipid/cholesterol/gamma-HCH transport system substrate-binding protein